MRRRFARLTFVGLALAFGVVPAVAADGYTVTDLGTLPGKANSWVWQQTINNGGLVAAYANDVANPNAFAGDVPFLWNKGRITVLPELPGAVDTIPFCLNDSGQLVGSSQPTGDSFAQPVLWDRIVRSHARRAWWRIQALGVLPGDNAGYAWAINNRRQAVGASCMFDLDASSFVYHAVLWHKDRTFQLPPLPGGGMADQAWDINDRGQIVGCSGPAFGQEHAALWYKGTVTDLGLIGGDWAEAIVINDRGQVAGMAQIASGDSHPFFWEKGAMSDLGVLGDDVFGAALDINNKGQIVGASGASIIDVTTSRAVLWANGVIVDLQTRIPADTGWTLLAAAGINERGQITGYGIHDGQYRAFLLTPAR